MSIYSTEKSKNQKNGPSGAPGPASASPWRAKRGALPKLSTFLSQLKGGPFGEKTNFQKKSHNAEKLKGGPSGIFKHPFCRKTAKKIEGGPFGEKFRKKKSRSAEKNWKGDPLVSPCMVSYAEKQEKLFWFSSLGQMVQFGAIIFRRTFKNYFDQFVWIEKKVTIIVAFHFMKHRLKRRFGRFWKKRCAHWAYSLSFEIRGRKFRNSLMEFRTHFQHCKLHEFENFDDRLTFHIREYSLDQLSTLTVRFLSWLTTILPLRESECIFLTWEKVR